MSGPKDVVLYVQNHRFGRGPIETSNSDARQAVLHAGDHR